MTKADELKAGQLEPEQWTGVILLPSWSASISSWILTSGFISHLQPTLPFELVIAFKIPGLGP